MDLPATLLWWNPAPVPGALFWHEAAKAARVVTVREHGEFCRIAIRPPQGVEMTSLLPPEIATLAHRLQPDILEHALLRVLGGARPPRVLLTGAVDSPELFAAAVAAFAPDRIARPDTEPSDAAERGRRRWGITHRYRIDELARFGDGVPAGGPPALLVPPHRPVSFLLPGAGGGAIRLVLHLGRAAAAPEVTLRLDAADLVARPEGDRITAVANVAARACHVLDLAQAGPDDLTLVAIEIGPA